jgi:type IV pilus assembly protein PilC
MKKDWHSILHSSLGDLARGKTSEFLQPRLFVRGEKKQRAVRAPRMLKRMRVFYIVNLLARLVKANAPLAQGLAAASPSAPSWGLSRSLYILSRDLEKGLSLHQAMRRQPSVFPAIYADLVEAGQKSGTLDQTFTRIMDEMTEAKTVGRELEMLMAYFAMVLGVFALFALFLNVKVMPVFDEIAHEIEVPGAYVPWKTYEISLMIRSYWVWYTSGAAIVAGILAASLLPSRLNRRLVMPRRVRGILSQIALHVPLVGRLVRSANMATCMQMFAQLVEAGVPLDAALDDLAEASINPAFAASFRRMRNKVRQGVSLSQAADSESSLLPRSFAVAAANAEYHGDLAGAMRNVALFYRAKAFRQMKMIKPVLMPFFILILGSLVFIQYFGGFVATINMSEMIMGGL